MKIKEIREGIYDVDSWLDQGLGAAGSPERAANRDKAWEEYNSRVLLDARKSAGLTQSELGARVGTDKSYISRVERGITVPSVAMLYRLAAAMGMQVQLQPV